jgi:hypothetical protein
LCVQTCCLLQLWQAAFKKYSMGEGRGGGGDKFHVSTKHQVKLHFRIF